MPHHVVGAGIIETFRAAMDRLVPDFVSLGGGGDKVINLGAGKKMINNSTPLDAEGGWWAGDPMPFEDASMAGAFAFHFFEHLDRDEIIHVMRELERVLSPGAVVTIMVPYYRSQMAFQDLDHKSFWNEGTLPNLFDCPYYDGTMSHTWAFTIRSQFIMGIVERNLGLFAQIVRK